MANIQKRPDGRYRARYRDPAGREHARHFDRKRDAEMWLDRVRGDMLRGDYVDPIGGKVIFKDRHEKWFSTTINLRPSTRARDESYSKSLILPTFGKRPLASIDHDSIQRWLAKLIAEGYAPSTVHKAHQILSKVMQSAVKGKLVPANPCDDSELPRIEREDQRFLTPDEVVKLAATIDERFRTLVLTAAYSGLRSGELYGLRRDHVDLDKSHIDVGEILVEVKGHIHYGPPKTRASKRRVPIPLFLAEELDKHVIGKEPRDLVFTAVDGGPVRSSLFRRRYWQPATITAGFAQIVEVPGKATKRYVGLRPHDLRHTAVAFWIEAGASPTEIARRAGHTSVVTVLDRYGHLLPRSDDHVTDALDAMGRAATASDDERDPLDRGDKS